MVGDGEGLVDVMVGDEDPDVFLFQFEDNTLDVFHGDGVNASEGFVEEDELGIDGEGAGDLCPSAFTA